MPLGMKDEEKVRRARANVAALRSFGRLERHKARVASGLQQLKPATADQRRK
jgi:hypothetical protein